MEWAKKETGREWNPYFYELEIENLKLQLSLPYKADPFTIRLLNKSGTIHKETFRLNEDETLENAKRIGIEIMKSFIKNNMNYWSSLLYKIERVEKETKYVQD